jgi:hypothetical protein
MQKALALMPSIIQTHPHQKKYEEEKIYLKIKCGCIFPSNTIASLFT